MLSDPSNPSMDLILNEKTIQLILHDRSKAQIPLDVIYCHGVVVMCAANDEQSLCEMVSKHYEEVLRTKNSDNFPSVFVVNKMDVEEGIRVVTPENVRQELDRMHMPYSSIFPLSILTWSTHQKNELFTELAWRWLLFHSIREDLFLPFFQNVLSTKKPLSSDKCSIIM